jgi:hypothetical protein
MKVALGLSGVMLFGLAGGGVARAQEPIDPYADARATRPAQPAEPLDPYADYPAPPAFGYQTPAAGVSQPTYTTPQYQQGYYLYPTTAAYPPSHYSTAYGASSYCTQVCATRAPVRRWDGVRRWSLGAHGTVLGVGQTVGGNNMVMGGAGFQLRLRSQGHFGFEASQSFLHASLYDGAFVRDSFPFQLSLMAYLFRNEDSRHFNIYALGGAGIVSDSVQLYDENARRVSQDFLEWELHAGLGAELRFRWFAIEADVRAIGLFRDNSGKPSVYYAGVTGGPIPDKTWGVMGNAYVSFWF